MAPSYGFGNARSRKPRKRSKLNLQNERGNEMPVHTAKERKKKKKKKGKKKK